jgi:hypothetical protein
MSGKRMIEWTVLAATVALLILLKWSHLGVLHYNWFVLILVGWTYGLIIFFRRTGRGERQNALGKSS